MSRRLRALLALARAAGGGRTAWVVTLSVAVACCSTFIGLLFKVLTDGVVAGDRTPVLVAAVLLAVAQTFQNAGGRYVLLLVADIHDRATLTMNRDLMRLAGSTPGLEHHERPDYLDRLSVLRDQMFVLDHMYMSVFSTCGWILRLGVTIGLLVSIHPALALLAVFALPTVATSSWRPGVEKAAQEKAAPSDRLAKHLFLTATSAPPGKEVRVTGIGEKLLVDRRRAWEGWYGPIAATRLQSAAWHSVAWAVFGLGFVGSVVFVSSVLDAPAGDVLLILAAGARLSSYIGATVGEIGFLRGIWMDGSRRMAWLEDYAESLKAVADQPVPDRLERGITFDHVSFAYPGTDRLVLDDVSLELPAGAVVAVVGENGAGKSTLVKLLCKLYEPISGQILVDGVPLSRMPAEDWRSRLAGAFQDFFRFELAARHSVGVGDAPRLDDVLAVGAAVERAGARDVVDHLPAGLETQLGPTWPGGVEVSFGQWQKLALGRGFMREDPLVLVLDEPTAALDAETEHALFERYAAAARRQPVDPREREAVDKVDAAVARTGRITILVSHRFSTVRMADLIVVLDGSRVVEVGTHADLVSRGGQYAELYGIQAASYR